MLLALSPLSGLGVAAEAVEARIPVTFNYNAYWDPGLAQSTTMYVQHGSTAPWREPKFLGSGRVFVGWQGPTGPPLDMWQFFQLIIEEPITFTAVWEMAWHPVHFNFNGGQDEWGSPGHTFHAPHGNRLPWWPSALSLTRPGYVFRGWMCNDGVILDEWQLAEWYVMAPRTFTAVWERSGNAPCADTNLARAATMSASSEQPARPAVRANNGIREGAVTNSWSAAGVGQEWLMVDFGEPVNFNHIRIFQGGNRILGYRFEYSNDGVNWTTFRSGARIMEAVPAAHYSFTIDTTMQARFVRLFSENSNSPTLPIVVFEFEVFYMP